MGDLGLLYDAAKTGDRIALARLLSAVERGGDDARAVGRLSWPAAGAVYTVGITGAPGSGKSTLTSTLLAVVRGAGERVAVLAVDPTSPFSGGAILGDRVRMQDHATDGDVYIRSMATRGHLGGLALATPQAVRVLDALGWPWVLIETVGVGQAEVDVAAEADTTIVVVNPAWGDDVQANKAGLLEIADIFVVNKADRPGVDDTARDLEQMLELSELRNWRPPIVKTVATTAEGADELWGAIGRHRSHLEESGDLGERRARRLDTEFREILLHRLEHDVRAIADGQAYAALLERVSEREIDPYAAADELLVGPSPRI